MDSGRGTPGPAAEHKRPVLLPDLDVLRLRLPEQVRQRPNNFLDIFLLHCKRFRPEGVVRERDPKAACSSIDHAARDCLGLKADAEGCP